VRLPHTVGYLELGEIFKGNHCGSPVFSGRSGFLKKFPESLDLDQTRIFTAQQGPEKIL